MTHYLVQAWRAQRWETPTRYYQAHVQQDLWGGWEVVRVWGGRGSTRGGVRCLSYASWEAACAALADIAARRRKRGYKEGGGIDPVAQDKLS